jgi:hypothetical protein
MKNLFVGFLLSIMSFVSFSQTYTFDVKNYDLYVTKGFFEKDTVIKNTNQFVSKVSDKHYVLSVDKKVAFVYENGVEEKFEITDVITNGDETEFIIESSVGGVITTFSIYLTLKNDNVTNICLFWWDPFNDLTVVKNVK